MAVRPTRVPGQRGAQVACRQFGFASGAEAIISTTSALPGPAGVTDIVSSIVCNGTEETLGDCGVFRETADNFCFGGEDSCNVALVCSNPTGVPLSCPVSVHLSIPRLYRTGSSCTVQRSFARVWLSVVGMIPPAPHWVLHSCVLSLRRILSTLAGNAGRSLFTV